MPSSRHRTSKSNEDVVSASNPWQLSIGVFLVPLCTLVREFEIGWALGGVRGRESHARTVGVYVCVVCAGAPDCAKYWCTVKGKRH